ncbi:14266_t:CDS:2, partial [Dentiscutata heterogama]
AVLPTEAILTDTQKLSSRCNSWEISERSQKRQKVVASIILSKSFEKPANKKDEDDEDNDLYM